MSEKTTDPSELLKRHLALGYSLQSIQYWYADPVPGFVLTIESHDGLTRAYIERLQRYDWRALLKGGK